MSEPVITRCSGCKAKLRIKNRDAVGKKIRCPKCETIFIVRPLTAVARVNVAAKSGDNISRTDQSTAPSESTLRDSSVTARGTLVSWEVGIGDDMKFHIAHVSAAGITLVLKIKDHAKWQEVVATARQSPDDASAMLQQLPKAVHLTPDEVCRATKSVGRRSLSGDVRRAVESTDVV